MAKRNVRARTIDGLKLCYKCSKWKEESEFSPRKAEADGLYYYCKRCVRTPHLQKYGLTWEKYDALVEAQEGVCALCQQPPNRAFDIDHDHACCSELPACGNCVRGLLCFNCNSALGKLKDDVDTLKRAVAYLTPRPGNKGA